MLALVMATGPLGLYAISALAPVIARDLGLSSGRLGLLALVSYGAAALSAIISGRLVDRFPPRRVQLLLFAGAGLTLVLIAVSQRFWLLIVAMFISGVAQSATNPVTNKLISEEVAQGRQGTIVGIKQSGVQLGQFFTGSALPPLALLLGWRPAVATGLILVLGGLWLTIRCVPPRTAPNTHAAEGADAPTRSLPLVRLALYTFCNAALVAMVNVHVPLYAHDAVGLSPGLAGGTAALIGGLGVAGRIAWGRAAERSPSYVGPLQALAALSLLSAVLLWAAATFGGWVLLAGTILFALSALPGNAVAMFAVIRSAGRRRTGAATGVMMLALYSGFTAGPSLFGLLVDVSGSYRPGWLLATAVAVASCLALFGMRVEAEPPAVPSPSSGVGRGDVDHGLDM